ncbi:two-component regulator propeller domain-containing protein [Aliiglaciecola sp. M165]|uniref:two-component regulator propeller domain-containing protein n=1 Tax=Aliiglaciecola sp. M165 TaxID=2593649 RepID=UPI00117D5DEF|nr:two-component regulator propeller domain-containing protein [Aliiglaciecola sp. M165]TRY29608.1 diguanylate cyclase [Aliiglaciecola sp. M165]
MIKQIMLNRVNATLIIGWLIIDLLTTLKANPWIEAEELKLRFRIIQKIMVKLSTLLLTLTMVSSALGDEENIRFQKIALEQGLSQEFIITAFQDSEGFMWFGTQEGLNRYDGYQFKVFTYSVRNRESLSSDWVFSIAEYDENTLWIGTRGGVNVFDKSSQTFSHLVHDKDNETSLSSDNVNVIHKSKNGKMWVGTGEGLNLYNPTSNSFQRIGLPDSSTDTKFIQSIVEDNNGLLWIAVSGRGLIGLDSSNGKIVHGFEDLSKRFAFSATGEVSLAFDSQENLWIGSQNGLDVVSLSALSTGESKIEVWSPEQTRNVNIQHIYKDRDDVMWVATDSGLFRLNSDGETFLHLQHDKQDPFSLSSQKLTYLYQDRGNVFWVGSNSGLNKWNTATANFDHIRVTADENQSLSGSYSTAFHDGKDGFMWLASLEGLDLLDQATGQITTLEFEGDYDTTLLHNKVMALHASEDGSDLFIGYREKGMSHLDVDTMTYKHYPFDPANPEGIGAPGVTTIKDAGNGKLWVGTFGGGLNLFDIQTGQFIKYKTDGENLQTLSSNRVLSITRMRNGLLWVGTWDKGLNIFNPTTGTAMRIDSDKTAAKSLGADTVWDILEDPNGSVWVGTAGAGLAKISKENIENGVFEFDRISRYEGLPSSTVFGILEDSNGFLWVSTNRGISKVNIETNELLNYDSSHGLQGNEFNSGAFHKARDGKMYFGGTNGVTAFYPDEIAPNQHIPPVVLTKFQKLNEVYSLDSGGSQRNNIQISHKDYLIAFEFAGLDFASPNNNRYLYKLEGFDNDWIEAGDIRKATYTNLPAGNYLFRVKASNNDGIWNEQGADVALTVLPAPWYSWWAYTIYALFALGLIYWIYRSYINKLEKEANYRHELELEVKNRTVELREANEQLLNASVTDQLTGLHNRRYLNSIIDQQCASVFRDFEANLKKGGMNAESGPRLFFLMFDLDGFKPINDTYGHDAGDKVICQVSDLLKTVCRKSDTVIRWGGDEFLVMGRVEETQEIELLAERLRSKIAAYGFDIDLKQKMHLSCSIGYSMFPFSHHYPDSLSWEQVHLLADNALYKSKEAGRNQWTGILQSLEMPPVSIMNTLTQNIDSVIGEGYVRIKQADRENAPKVLDIKSRRR